MKDSAGNTYKPMMIQIKTIDGAHHKYDNVETYDLHGEYMLVTFCKDSDDAPDHQAVFPLRSIMNAEIWES